MKEKEQEATLLAVANGGGILELDNPIRAKNVIVNDEKTLDDYINKRIDNDIIVIGGHRIALMPFQSSRPYAVADNKGTAWIKLNVGVEKKGMRGIVTTVTQPGTPYTAVKNISLNAVTTDGYLEMEIYGTGFIMEHIFVFSIMLFD